MRVWRMSLDVRHTRRSHNFTRACAPRRHLFDRETAGEGEPRRIDRRPTATTRTASSAPTRGVLYVHSAPSALCPHIEWAVGGVLGIAVNLDWTPQPAQAGTYRAELSWVGGVGSAAAVASALKGWQHLRFEITEEPTSGS